MRAFIFSLDAFVAFTLALVAVYSLIFFSAIPSSYYYLLTQAHYLARDTLFSLSTADCAPYFTDCMQAKGSVIDNIAFGEQAARENFIIKSVGASIPNQFGYVMELSSDNGNSWSVLYDTARPDPGDTDGHAKTRKRLSVSSQVIVFDYSANMTKDSPNPFTYRSCNGGGAGTPTELLTCSGLPNNPYGSGGGALDLVPSTGIRLVRLTVFI